MLYILTTLFDWALLKNYFFSTIVNKTTFGRLKQTYIYFFCVRISLIIPSILTLFTPTPYPLYRLFLTCHFLTPPIMAKVNLRNSSNFGFVRKMWFWKCNLRAYTQFAYERVVTHWHIEWLVSDWVCKQRDQSSYIHHHWFSILQYW